ncbi:hypothetical protein A2841_01970 [Candidatus Kaiserbacteria bacterium RIFCSPHIGHO2_01_FULL_48_10]|uniref:PEGA domain-containing protein n=1 Tax=Candidatus Kaiserbacteria bacterium RIFCSPHIGHO2_01_FULL_48_10 TaxID=1798476 RepID=A0A1F6C6H4_9BACT|nr:MAG: hypothetical protein A2841_01970 [Candidatus Kaiserbacteria bacterium RIFCSPHIGHO2_01_FULL_48_10]
MSLNSRRILAAAFVLIFLVATPLLVLWSSGFRWNPKKWSWQQTGTISMETLPSGATVFLNEIQLNKKTPTVINALLPDIYEVRIEKDGYANWSERVEVTAGKTTIGKGILLLPKIVTRENEQAVSGGSEELKQNSVALIEKRSKEYGIEANAEGIKQIVRNVPSTQERRVIAQIADEITDVLDVSNDSFVLLKNEKNQLIIGSIGDTALVETDTLDDVLDYHWNDKKTILTVAAGLELLQYHVLGAKIQKTLITRASHPFERVLPLADIPYLFVEQEHQIKIIEQNALGVRITPLVQLRETESILFWKLTKKLKLTVWTKEQDKFFRFEISLEK